MPSALHEGLIQLFHDAPEFVTTILGNVSAMTLMGHTRIETRSESATVLEVAERRVDAVFEVNDDSGRFAVALEVQLRPEDAKLWRWPTYIARLRERLGCPVALLVICMNNRTAKWAAEPIFLGRPDSYLRPLAMGPKDVPVITETDASRVTPELALLSTLAHGRRRGRPTREMVDILDSALGKMDTHRAVDYTELALGLLSTPARSYLEGLMATVTKPYHSEFTDRIRVEAEARGKACGEAAASARMLLLTLESREVGLSDEQRRLIENCVDSARLEAWFRRALTATTAEDVFG